MKRTDEHDSCADDCVVGCRLCRRRNYFVTNNKYKKIQLIISPAMLSAFFLLFLWSCNQHTLHTRQLLSEDFFVCLLCIITLLGSREILPLFLLGMLGKSTARGKGFLGVVRCQPTTG